MSDEEAPQGQGGGLSDGGGYVGGSGASNVRGWDAPSIYGVVPLEEEMYTPPMTRSCTKVGFLGFDATYFYQYTDDHFSLLKLRLDAIIDR